MLLTIDQSWQDVESAGPPHDYELFKQGQRPLGYQIRFLMVKRVSSRTLEKKRTWVAGGCATL